VTVAVKENFFLTDEYARQFQREANILASLRHPSLPRVFDYFVVPQEGQYLVMDYIQGEDLRQWIARDETLSEIETIQVGVTICDALIYMHSREPSILHRDIKPGNVKITPDGDVVLVDFGLAKLMLDGEVTTTAARAMTPGYSPPEQYGSAPTDSRTDVYSLGATLYAAITGFIPEDGLARATGGVELTQLRKHNINISRRLASTIEKALAIRFEDRWQSALDFKNALLRARDSLPQEAWHQNRISDRALKATQRIAEQARDPSSLTMVQRFWAQLREKLQQRDPVWLIFGMTLILLVIVLAISIIRPVNFENLFNMAEGTTTSIVVPTERTPEPEITESLLPGAAIHKMPTTEITPTPVQEEVVFTPTPMGGGQGVLAYVSEQNGAPQIWLVDIADAQKEVVTDLMDGACQPSWSPDGEKIAFISPCSGRRSRYPGASLVILNLEDGQITPLPPSLEGEFDPAWSPDGQWIAYTTLVNGQMQVAKVNMDDLSRVMLSDGQYDDFQPTWSPDGETIAFVRIRSVGQIWLMDADGKNQRQFTLSGAIDNSHPVFHPNFSVILFSQALGLGSPSTKLMGMRLENIGKDLENPIETTTKTEYIALMDHVAFSPDGLLMAFEYWYSDVLSDIYVMAYPGSNLIQMTTYNGEDYDPDWRP
jgi:serine/threonine protein kinase/Tol biopolymer transport system component